MSMSLKEQLDEAIDKRTNLNVKIRSLELLIKKQANHIMKAISFEVASSLIKGTVKDLKGLALRTNSIRISTSMNNYVINLVDGCFVSSHVVVDDFTDRLNEYITRLLD